MSSVPPSTIPCLLCGGSFLFPGPRYAAHLLHEHGVIYDTDFLIRVSQHKKSYAILPTIPKQVAEGSSQTRHSAGAGDTQTRHSAGVGDTQTRHSAVAGDIQTRHSAGAGDIQTRHSAGSGDRLCSSCSPHQDADRREVQDSYSESWNNHNEEDVKEENVTYDVNWDISESVVVKPDIDEDFGASFVNKSAGPLASDMQCYFNCGEVFKKGYDLQIHIKLRHKDEDPVELARAEEAARFEIALTKRSGCVYKCALCEKIVEGWSAFWEHIRKHRVSLAEYKAKYGKCEIETASFQCRVCEKVLKHETNIIQKHLQYVHGISWTQYLARVRQELRGIKQEPLPEIILEKCKICNLRVKYMKLHMRNKHGFSKKERCKICDASVKYIKTHLKKTHGVTSDEYHQLTGEESAELPFLDINQNAKYMKSPPSDSDSSPTDFSDVSLMSNTSRLSMDILLPKPSKAEMSDKTVRNCSVCDILFDSRKSYIDHCQVVHGVRFKTKSLGLWRMSPSCPEVEQPTSKQLRTVQSTANQSRAIESTTDQIREIQSTSNQVRTVQLNFSGGAECQPPPSKVSKIVWPQKQGSLVCEDCGEKFTTWRFLDQHMKLNCKRVACESCGKTYSSLFNLKKHIKSSCQGQLNLSLSSDNIAREIVDQVISRVFSVSRGPCVVFKCPVEDCGQQFGRSVHLRRHLANYHDQ